MGMQLFIKNFLFVKENKNKFLPIFFYLKKILKEIRVIITAF